MPSVKVTVRPRRGPWGTSAGVSTSRLRILASPRPGRGTGRAATPVRPAPRRVRGRSTCAASKGLVRLLGRSLFTSDSNWASAENTVETSLPPAESVSGCSVSETSWQPRASTSLTSWMRWDTLRPRRSSCHIASRSPPREGGGRGELQAVLRVAPAVVGEDLLAAAPLQGSELVLGILLHGGHSGVTDGH